MDSKLAADRLSAPKPLFTGRVAESMEGLEKLAVLAQSGSQCVTIECDDAPFVAAEIRVVLSELQELKRQVKELSNDKTLLEQELSRMRV